MTPEQVTEDIIQRPRDIDHQQLLKIKLSQYDERIARDKEINWQRRTTYGRALLRPVVETGQADLVWIYRVLQENAGDSFNQKLFEEAVSIVDEYCQNYPFLKYSVESVRRSKT